MSHSGRCEGECGRKFVREALGKRCDVTVTIVSTFERHFFPNALTVRTLMANSPTTQRVKKRSQQTARKTTGGRPPKASRHSESFIGYLS